MSSALVVAHVVSAHTTEAVYRRYAIVAKSDLEAGVTKLAGLALETAPKTLPGD